MDVSHVLLHDILGFQGNETGRYYIGVVVGVQMTDQGRAVEVKFWMPKAKVLDNRSVLLTNMDKIDLIGALPDWAEWDDG